MKKNLSKHLLICALLVGLSSYVGSAGAHFKNNNFIVNKTEQVFTFVCPATTSYSQVRVKDKSANAGIMSSTLFKDGTAKSVTDLVQGDANFSSTYATVSGGAGTYYILITQTSAASGSFDLEYHCWNAANVEVAGPTVTLTQP